LWDIGIETLPEYRRHGYAEQCVQFMVAHHLQRGKHPVWGAEESNLASLNLAAKLGFKAVDRVVLFRRSGE
jgi:predicted GNAT family acetyltransferase